MESNALEEVREIARMKGILSANKFEHKVDLIRMIQLADGREPCFMADWECPSGFCMWAEECIRGRKVVAFARKPAVPFNGVDGGSYEMA